METWNTHLDYLLVLLGFSVGVGSLWKFPYLCMRNGGGAFLIPFIVFTILGAIPCVFLEMTIGQFSQSGPVNVWNLCPPFKGLGVGMILIATYFAIYMPVMFAWFLYYLYHSFFTNIPWANCDNRWNSPTCVSHKGINTTHNVSTTASNVSIDSASYLNSSCPINATTNISNATTNTSNVFPGMTAAEEFWRFNVLEITDGLDYLGGMRWPMIGCHAITYIGLFLIMFKGIKVSGKVVYATVALPYILITVFLIRGCLLPGAADGIYYYIYPKFDKLLDPELWIEACNYALFSLGIGSSCIITMAGHNKFSNNCFRDAMILTAVDAATAIYIGFAFFAVMGHVAHLRGVTVESFESSGWNLGFIVYPEAVASLPLPQLWSALTFVMLLTLGIDTVMPCFEIAVTALADLTPRLAHRRWLLYLIVLTPSFFIGMIFLTQGGMYVLTLVEWYALFPSMVMFAMLECFVVSWIYGTTRMERDVASMWGKTVPRVMNVALKYICPILYLVVFSYSLYSYRPPKYGDYVFPAWATLIGWILSFSSIIPLPIIFIWSVYKTEGSTFKEKIRKSMEPTMKWGPPANKDPLNTTVLETMM